MTITGSAGNDSIYSSGKGLIDVSAGGTDDIYAYNGANITGYDAQTGSKMYVDVDDIFNSIFDGEIIFGNGSFSVAGAEQPVVTDKDAGDIGSMLNNIANRRGESSRVLSTYTHGGTADGSNSDQALIIVGNANNYADGEAQLIGSSNNDSFIGGANDNIVTGSGTNDVYFKNTNADGAKLDQTVDNATKTVNNLGHYNPVLNLIRITTQALGELTARFIDGRLVTKFGNTTNKFLPDSSSDLTALKAVDDEVTKVLDIPIDDISLKPSAIDDVSMHDDNLLPIDGSAAFDPRNNSLLKVERADKKYNRK